MSPEPVRRVEIVAALSLATDLAIGQPVEFALKSCALAVALADAAKLDRETARQVYYQSLLRYIGCNAETDWMSSVVGDEQQLRAGIAPMDQSNLPALAGMLVRGIHDAHAGASTLDVARAIGRGLLSFPKLKPLFTAHCEVAQRLAERFGFGPGVVYALGQLYERWDGKGLPNGLRGEAIAPAVLVVSSGPANTSSTTTQLPTAGCS